MLIMASMIVVLTEYCHSLLIIASLIAVTEENGTLSNLIVETKHAKSGTSERMLNEIKKQIWPFGNYYFNLQNQYK